jgi:hypothetical protein
MGIGALEDIERLLRRLSGLSIGIVTDDFSKIHDLVRKAREMDLSITIIGEDEVMYRDFDSILLDDPESVPLDEIRSSNIVEMMDDPEGSLQRALAAAMEAFNPERLAVGIDPGKRPGVAFIADGRLISVYKSSSPKAAVNRVLLMKEAVKPQHLLVRLGDGDPSNRDRTLKYLNQKGIPVEIVDESMTTTARRYRDEVSALAIALTPGNPM